MSGATPSPQKSRPMDASLRNPTRILWSRHATNPERLLRSADQAIVGDPSQCVLRHGGDEPGVLLDFGREIHGSLQLVTTTYDPKKPLRVRVRFGESASEAMGETDQDHAIHDQVLLVPWCGSVEVGPTGFRFARIDLLDAGTTLGLTGALARLREISTPRVGSFTCSDRRVNAVWEVAARSVELCMQDYLWDGIKRDRLVWMGDLHPEIMVVHALHGAHPVVQRSLDLVRDTTPLPAWMNGLSSYSLWWIRVQYDWFQRTGDRTYLAAQLTYLTGLLEQVLATIGPDGSHSFPMGLIDWATAHDPATTTAGMHALLAWSLDAGAGLCHELGEAGLADRCRTAIRALIAHGVPPASTKQAAALAVLGGMRDPVEANRAVLAKDPGAGLSPFYGYYVLEARAKAGDIGGGLDLLRTYWGAMLDLGATSFWEHFDEQWLVGEVPAGRIDELPGPGARDIHRTTGDHCYRGLRHSFCHGWSGGPAAWLPEQVLGVTPASPGYATVRIAPQLGGLEWAEGVVPTPHGPIRVRAQRGADPEIHLPKGVQRIV